MDCGAKYGLLEGEGKINRQRAITLHDNGDISLRFRMVKIRPGEMSKENLREIQVKLKQALEIVEKALA